ncbi:hypothetical protein VSS37_15825 [Candidatus Thiothrix sp. Deng01]|uniref:Uncharacterized protein n=1 Tax=Candidatus Thiothrix phosphatis TaxID=3112415 RepID=A0ABU6D044_9GAMM|nr:hypothetical protein [Candidatus Thiothrix sp. Deng01]MEB4592454.1 hypothetical protein [Candidatus Thiothrix sp. Deng01]
MPRQVGDQAAETGSGETLRHRQQVFLASVAPVQQHDHAAHFAVGGRGDAFGGELLAESASAFARPGAGVRLHQQAGRVAIQAAVTADAQAERRRVLQAFPLIVLQGAAWGREDVAVEPACAFDGGEGEQQAKRQQGAEDAPGQAGGRQVGHGGLFLLLVGTAISVCDGFAGIVQKVGKDGGFG